MFCANISALPALFESVDRSVVGNSDSSNVFFIDRIMELFPETNLVLIERPYKEVEISLNELGICNIPLLDLAVANFNHTKQKYKHLLVHFDDLNEINCEKIWNYCVQTKFDKVRWKMLDKLNIEIILNKEVEEVKKHMSSIHSLFRGII